MLLTLRLVVNGSYLDQSYLPQIIPIWGYDQEDHDQGRSRQKCFWDPIWTKGWAQWCIPVTPATAGSMNRRPRAQVVGIEERTCLKRNQPKKDLQSGSRGRVPAYHAQSPEFNTGITSFQKSLLT
jgi:hypothetical protein